MTLSRIIFRTCRWKTTEYEGTLLRIAECQLVTHAAQRRYWRILFAMVMLTAATPVLAKHEAEHKPDMLERSRSSVTRSLNYITEKIDAFFGDNRTYEDSVGSWARLNLQTRVQQKASPEYNSSVQVRIALPRTQGRFNVIVESDTSQNLEDGVFSNDPLTAVTDPTYSGGLRYIIRHDDKWYAHADAGIQFGAPIDLFVRGRLRRNYQLKEWRFQVAETVTFYQSARAHAVTQADLEHLLNKNLLFRNRLTLGLRKLPEKSDWSFDTSFIQRLDSKQAIQYQYMVLGNYDTLYVTDFIFNLRYRRNLQRKWMFIEITPQVLYSEINNFAYTPSIYFKLEMLFRKD